MSLVRISVANLAPYLRAVGTDEVVALGIIDARKFNDMGMTQFTALGGGAVMDQSMMAFLEREYSAVFKNRDARFEVDVRPLETIMSIFSDPKAHACEVSVRREFTEETVDESVGGKTVLTAEEAMRCTETFLGYVRQAQPEDGVGTSLNATVVVPTHRLFGIFAINAPLAVFKKIVASPLIRTFTENELDSTRLGASRGETCDGYHMSDNLGNWFSGMIKSR